MAQNFSSTKSYVFRLKPGEDLRKEIELFVKQNNIKAAIISTRVGSLTEANIRFANQPNGKTLKGFFEILSLSGVVSINGSHIHIAVADKKGQNNWWSFNGWKLNIYHCRNYYYRIIRIGF